jgi:hypothetical protein
MTVYKYVNEDRIDVLEYCRIRFTQASALNDPFDVNPCLTDFIQGSIGYANEQFKREKPTPAEALNHALQVTEAFRKQLDLDYLILSLSKRNNNMLMWAYYANCHRGLIFGFDENHRFFRGTGITTGLMKVDYSEKRFRLPKAEEWINDDAVLPAFLRKSNDWSYEEEVRVFARSVAACEVKSDPQSGAPIFLLPFQKELCTEVVFGIYTPETVKLKVIELLDKVYPHVKLFQAQLNDTSFDLDIRPVARKIGGDYRRFVLEDGAEVPRTISSCRKIRGGPSPA